MKPFSTGTKLGAGFLHGLIVLGLMKACSVRWPLGIEIEEALGEFGFLGVRLRWELWVNVAVGCWLYGMRVDA